jgi:hypothetical protein
MKLQHETHDIYDETLTYTIYRISLSHKCRIKKYPAQV